MPFTFCHPAIVLPLNRIKGLSLTGLIAGSVAPDFEYFIRMTDKRIYTHNWSGVLWIDTPLALLLTFLFHLLVRNQLINNAPIRFQKRLKRYENFNWVIYFKKHWLLVALSAALGAYSHLIWDGFTHETGYFVKYLPFLASAIPIGTLQLEVHLLLQILSSILGALVIYYALWQIPVDKSAKVNTSYFRFWKRVILLSIIVFSFRLLLGISSEIEDIVIPAISAVLVALVITAIIFKKGNI